MRTAALAIGLVAGLCAAQAVQDDPRSAWIEHERSLFKEQQLEQFDAVPLEVRRAAELVDDMRARPWVSDPELERSLLSLDERVPMMVRALAAQRAFEQLGTLTSGLRWLVASFDATHPELKEFHGFESIRAVPHFKPVLDRHLDPPADGAWSDDDRAAFASGCDEWTRRWNDHLLATGFWNALDVWSDVPAYLPRQPLRDHDGHNSLIAQSLMTRLRIGLVDADPDEIAASIRALDAIGYCGRQFGNEPLEGMLVHQQVYNVVQQAVSNEALVDEALAAVSESLRTARSRPVIPWLLRDHARMLEQIEGFVPGQAEAKRYTQAQIAFWQAWRLGNADMRAAAEEDLGRVENQHIAELPMDRLLISSVVGPNRRVRSADLNIRASWSAADVIAACERARLKWGRWPVDLQEIIPQLLAEVPRDPWSAEGEPLQFRLDDDGFALWSVGPDGENNDAAVDPQTPWNPGEEFDLVLWPRQ